MSVLVCTCRYMCKCVYAWVKCAVLEYACIVYCMSVHCMCRSVHAGTCIQYMYVLKCVWMCVRSHSCGLDFVPRGAHPPRVVGQSLALFSLQTWFHLTPPFPNYNGRWGRWAQIQNENRLVNRPDTRNSNIYVCMHTLQMPIQKLTNKDERCNVK